jgi:hypothetical protein
MDPDANSLSRDVGPPFEILEMFYWIVHGGRAGPWDVDFATGDYRP